MTYQFRFDESKIPEQINKSFNNRPLTKKSVPENQLERNRARMRQIESTATQALVVPTGLTSTDHVRRKRFIKRRTKK